MGPAWSALYSPFQVSFAGSMAFGLGALLALDRGTRRGDIGASALLVGSLACSGLGLPWLAFVAVELAVRDRRRLWVIAAPLVLYAIWYLAYGGNSEHDANAGNVMAFVLNAGASALGGYAGLDVTWGRSLLVAGLALALWRLSVLGRVPARTAGAVAAGVTFWGLTGLVRDPSTFAESRYLLAGATFLVLAAAPLLPRGLPSRGVLAGAALAAVVAVLAGSSSWAAGRTILVDGNQPLYARLQAVELARPAVKNLDYVIDDVRRPTSSRPGTTSPRWTATPAPRRCRSRRSGPPRRPCGRRFDEAMVRVHGLALAPATARPSGAAPAAESSGARTAGACLVGDGSSLVATLPAGRRDPRRPGRRARDGEAPPARRRRAGRAGAHRSGGRALGAADRAGPAPRPVARAGRRPRGDEGLRPRRVSRAAATMALA